MEKPVNKIPIQFILVIILGLFYISASVTRDFHSRGEPREALVMQDMLNNSEYILPQGYGGVVPSKPPLLHWTASIFSLPFAKITEFSARLPSILAACFIVILSFCFFKNNSSKAIALLSTLILASSIEWLRAATAARVDMLLTAALMCAFLTLYNWSGREYKGYPWYLVISVTLAILCKGPVGVVLPALVYLAISFFDKVTFWQIVKRGLLIFMPALLIALCWYGAAYLSRPEQFLQKVYYENVARFLSIQDDEPHKASASKLYGTVVLGVMPWTLILIAIWFKKLRFFGFTYLKPKWSMIKDLWKNSARIDRFALIVVITTLVFYSIPAGKRSVYVLPIYPFLSFWIAKICLSEAKLPSSRIFINAAKVTAFISILIILIVNLFLFQGNHLASIVRSPSSIAMLTELRASIFAYYASSSVVLVVSCIFIFILLLLSMTTLFKSKKEQGLIWFMSILFSLFTTLQFSLVPAIVNPISPKVFATQVLALVPEQTQLLSFGEEFYGLSFYTRRRFLRAEEAGFSVGSIIVVADDDFQKLKEKMPATLSLELISRSNGSVMSYGKHLGLFKIVS